MVHAFILDSRLLKLASLLLNASSENVYLEHSGFIRYCEIESFKKWICAVSGLLRISNAPDLLTYSGTTNCDLLRNKSLPT